jgi:DNA-directed RNA polymerase specialized sigma24 family protein
MREGETLRKGRRQVNDRREREELFRAYYAGVLAFALSQVESLERAKAIAAAAFDAVLGASALSAAPAGPRVMLFTHARLAIESGRRRSWGSAPAPAAPLDAHVSSELQRVQACVGQLSRREQGVVSLRFDAALSSQEIGLVMGMTEVEVMVVVLRSLRRIKACLEAGAGGAAPPTRRPAKPSPG